jgi:hypothetical protein
MAVTAGSSSQPERRRHLAAASRPYRWITVVVLKQFVSMVVKLI